MRVAARSPQRRADDYPYYRELFRGRPMLFAYLDLDLFDIWLSPAYQRVSAYIAVHMYKGMPYTAYFRYVESIYGQYQGRPHWGKLHTLDYRALEQLYPCWNDFLRARAA